jgi:hypothetical protein
VLQGTRAACPFLCAVGPAAAMGDAQIPVAYVSGRNRMAVVLEAL